MRVHQNFNIDVVETWRAASRYLQHINLQCFAQSHYQRDAARHVSTYGKIAFFHIPSDV